MAKLFGTDGVRGVANRELTGELAYALGRAGAFLLAGGTPGAALVVGKDTRASGDLLEAALAAGICSAGVRVLRAGVIPTPAVSFLVRELGAAGGAVVSASHNPAADNGIKFFDARGIKLLPEKEEEIEELIFAGLPGVPSPAGGGVGRIYEATGALERYLRYLKQTTPVRFEGLKVVLDCAHGATYVAAPALLAELGAEVETINASPDGLNINQNCGSLYPEALKETVREKGAHLGLAYDGDGDRVIAVDEKGEIVDGDKIMVICGLFLKKKNLLAADTVVVTVMSNLGLHLAFQRAGVKVRQTPVGDRYVLAEMLKTGAGLGGEQSGHIIFREHGVTGDGLVTTCQLLRVMVETGEPLSALAAQMECVPQVLVNVRVKRKEAWRDSPELCRALAWAEEKLAGKGRVLVRPSGTEPLLRIMAEGPSEEELWEVVGELKRVAERALN